MLSRASSPTCGTGACAVNITAALQGSLADKASTGKTLLASVDLTELPIKGTMAFSSEQELFDLVQISVQDGNSMH